VSNVLVTACLISIFGLARSSAYRTWKNNEKSIARPTIIIVLKMRFIYSKYSFTVYTVYTYIVSTCVDNNNKK
jgi:hypothetical protein